MNGSTLTRRMTSETPARTVETTTAWVGDAVRRGAVRFELRFNKETHARARDDGRVCEWMAGDAPNPTLIAAEAHQQAEDDAAHQYGRRAVYSLLAYRTSEATTHAERHFISKAAGGSDPTGDPGGLGAIEHETATAAGVIGQMMRHNEAAVRMSLGTTAQVLKHYQQIIDAQNGRIAELEERCNEFADTYEKLTSETHQRAMEKIQMEQKAAQSRERMAFMRDKIDLVLPAVIAMLTGKKGAPMAMDATLTQLFKTLRPEQIETIFGALDPEQMVALNALYQSYGAREMAREAEAERKASKAA
jgi:hypothetical protein